MNENKFPFPAAWFSVELEGYRMCPEPGTYCLFPYESLPPLATELFHGDFQWLTESGREAPLSESDEEYLQSEFSRVTAAAAEMGLQLPKPFLELMASSELRSRIPSATDCYFELPDHIAEYPPASGRYLIEFLSDSQGCLYWYLYLAETGEHCVVVSDFEFGSDWEDPEAGESDGRVFYCAPTFEAFIYRLWIENEIWFALNEKRPLTEGQQVYVDHYRTRPGASPGATSSMLG